MDAAHAVRLGEGAGPDQGEAPEVGWKQIGTACQQLAGILSGGEPDAGARPRPDGPSHPAAR